MRERETSYVRSAFRRGPARWSALAALVGAGVIGYGVRAARAGIPSTQAFTYAGVLENGAGQALTGTHNIQVSIWDAATAGNKLCEMASAQSVALANGRFAVSLPDTCATSFAAKADAWIDVALDGASTGRSKIGVVPYAVEASHATSATSATSATNANNATTAGTATNASNATNATHATNSDSANHLTSSIGLHVIDLGWDGNLNVFVDGTLSDKFASSLTKTFIISHPTDPERYLVHGTLEGPENAVFYRGAAHLRGGVAEITLPAYFEAATRPAGRTVLVTPKFSRLDEPVSVLAASEVRAGVFVVRSIDSNNPAQTFDWEVKAVRADAPPLLVEPRRDAVTVAGDGPYKYFRVK